MDFTVELSKDLIKDMDNIIENFVEKHRDDVVSVEALAICLGALIDKRNGIEDMFKEEDNE